MQAGRGSYRCGVLAARARTFVLALAAGGVDAIGFLLLFGIFTAHLSGDTTRLAVDLGRGDLGSDALARIVVLVTFVAGLVVGVAVVAVQDGRDDRGERVLEGEIALLTAVMVVASIARDDGALGRTALLFYLLVAALALAMGLQNGFLRRAAGTGVHTTFVTGMLTAMAEDTVVAWRDPHDLDARRRIRIHGGIWVAYLVGGVVGAALALAWTFWALLVPIALLLVVRLAGQMDAPTP